MADEWVEAGAKPSDELDVTKLALSDNKRYQAVVTACQKVQADLLKLEEEGFSQNYRENPSLIGDYLGRLRLNANQLFAFMNVYIDILNDLQLEYSKARQDAYTQKFLVEKTSASGSETFARETTQLLGAKVKVIENLIQQIKNDYERYNSIAMYLQSRMKEFNTEKILG